MTQIRTEADVLAALERYLDGKADGEIVGYGRNVYSCPVALALPGDWRRVSRDRITLVTGQRRNVLNLGAGAIRAFITAVDALGSRVAVDAATARRLLSEIRGG